MFLTVVCIIYFQVCYSLMMPANEPLSEDAFDFQVNLKVHTIYTFAVIVEI